MKGKRIYRRGDIYLVDLGSHYGSEQGGCRPVLLIQNNVGNYYGPTLIVAPITSRFAKKRINPRILRLWEWTISQIPRWYLPSRYLP